MALDPRDLVSRIVGGAHDAVNLPPPPTLSRPVRPDAPLGPIRDSDTVAGLHREWSSGDGAAASTVGTLLGRAEAALRSLATGLSNPAQRRDRALIGSLIRAVDTLATRCDELAVRVESLETVLGEVADAASADLTRIRALVSGSGSIAAGPTGEALPGDA